MWIRTVIIIKMKKKWKKRLNKKKTKKNKKNKKGALTGREPTSLILWGHRGNHYATESNVQYDKIFVYVTSRKQGIKYRLFPSLFAY